MRNFIAFLIVGLLTTSSYSAMLSSVSRKTDKGSEIATMDSVGVKIVSKAVATTETVGVAGAGILYGIVMSSAAAATDYVVISDSTTAVTTSEMMRLYPGTAGAVVDLPRPVRFANGVTYLYSAAGAQKISFIYLLNSER